jgi:hypothetical protein
VDELRKDPTRGQWVLIRPKGQSSDNGHCPYCPGAEHLSGAEIAAYRKEGSEPNGPEWTVRVVPEADAYFRVEWEVVREGVGMFDMITPRGASELIVESPRHDDTLATVAPEQLESVLWMYHDRLVDLKKDGQIRDILNGLEEKGVTIFLNSHLLVEVELFCRDVAIIHKGKLALEGKVKELTAGSGYRVEAEKAPEQLVEQLRCTATAFTAQNGQGLSRDRLQQNFCLQWSVLQHF